MLITAGIINASYVKLYGTALGNVLLTASNNISTMRLLLEAGVDSRCQEDHQMMNRDGYEGEGAALAVLAAWRLEIKVNRTYTNELHQIIQMPASLVHITCSTSPLCRYAHYV
jgi:hypothetical protein